MLIKVRDGQELYVEHHQNGQRETILMIHGGPGESCITFSPLAEALKNTADVVLVDQRGVLRSREEPEEEKLNMDQILCDFEDIREALGIDGWVILGHSFGGRLAAAYAGRYPDSVRAVILENPAIYIEKSVGALLERYKDLFKDLEGRFPDACGQSRRLMEAEQSGDFQKKLGFIARVPAKYRCICFGNTELSKEAQRLFLYPGYEEADIKKCSRVMEAVSRDKGILTDGYEDLKKSGAPLLVLRDRNDPLLTMEELAYFEERGTVHSFSGCGHYIHLAASGKMADCIRGFLRA